MNLHFTSQEHKEAMGSALEKIGGKAEKSIEIPLYLLTSMPKFQDLDNLKKVFVFEGQYFDPDSGEQFSLSTGENILFDVAMNTYNGYVGNQNTLDPNRIMSWLSKEYREVLLSALTNRYVA